MFTKADAIHVVIGEVGKRKGAAKTFLHSSLQRAAGDNQRTPEGDTQRCCKPHKISRLPESRPMSGAKPNESLRLKGEHAALVLNWERLEEGETVLLGWWRVSSWITQQEGAATS